MMDTVRSDGWVVAALVVWQSGVPQQQAEVAPAVILIDASKHHLGITVPEQLLRNKQDSRDPHSPV
jgi:hypothetical protein